MRRWADSEVPGSGATSESTGQVGGMREPRRLKILVVEDEPEESGSIARLLRKKLKAVVETAGDGREAIRKFNARHFDLVTLDYQLPDINGLDLLKHMMLLPTPPVVVMVTGCGFDEVALEAMRSGAAGYVMKDARFARSLAHVVEETLTDWRPSPGGRPPARSEREYLRLVEGADSIVLTSDSAGRLTYINPFARRFFGFDSGEEGARASAARATDATVSSSLEVTGFLEQMLSGSEMFVMKEEEDGAGDGSRTWIAWSDRALGKDAGPPDVWACGNLAGRALLRDFTSLADGLTEPVTIISTDGGVLYQNRAYSRLLGYPERETGAAQAVYALPLPQVRELVEEASGAGDSAEARRRLELDRADGSRVPVEVSTSPLLNESGEAIGFLALYKPRPDGSRAERAQPVGPLRQQSGMRA